MSTFWLSALVVAGMGAAPSSETPVKVGFGAQMRAVVPTDDPEASRLTVHRVRPRLSARTADDRFRFKFHFDLAPRALELLDLSVRVALPHEHALTVGVGKLPFSDHWRQGYLDLGFVDWPLTTRWFGGGRQLGFKLAGPASEHWRYELGVYSGETLRPANGARFSTLYGQKTPNHLGLVQYAPLGTPHPEAAMRWTRDGRHNRLVLSLTQDFRPEHTRDESLRAGADGRVDWGPVQIRGGVFAAAAQTVDGLWMPALVGALLEPRWYLNPRVDISARYAVVARSRAVADDALEFAGRLGEEGLERARAIEAEAAVRSRHELALGVGVNFVEGRVRWVTDGVYTRHDGPHDGDGVLRTQLQVSI